MKKSILLTAVLTMIISLSTTIAQSNRTFITVGMVNNELGGTIEYKFKKSNMSIIGGISHYEGRISGREIYALTQSTNTEGTHKTTSYNLGLKFYTKALNESVNLYVLPQIIYKERVLELEDYSHTWFLFFHSKHIIEGSNRTETKNTIKGALSGGLLYTMGHFAFDASFGITIGSQNFSYFMNPIGNFKVGVAF